MSKSYRTLHSVFQQMKILTISLAAHVNLLYSDIHLCAIAGLLMEICFNLT